jgi:cell volume regulation protein A
MQGVEWTILIGGFLLLCSVVSSRLSSKLGIPSLILFLGLGMLAGSESLGQIHFSDTHFAHDLGYLALVLILFSGGLDTPWAALKGVLAEGLLLATVGVAVTAGLVGVFGVYVLQLSWMEALLLGSIVASTDAAAVFGVLRGRGLRLKHRLVPTLELESGSNDPTAVFLTVTLTALIKHPEGSSAALILAFLWQMAAGAGFGWLLGRATHWVINKVRLDYDGLYPAVTIASALITYGGVSLLGGNGFLAVYVCALTLGSRPFVHRLSLIQFHDGAAWLMQIVVFLCFGLLVFPSQLASVVWPSLALAAFLVFIARPLAVMLSLPFSRMKLRDKAFISWVGLRGAVPIILATIPLNEGIDKANYLFNIVFFVVVVSVLVQGTSIEFVARKLKVLVKKRPESKETPTSRAMIEVTVRPDSRASGRRVVDLLLPPTALLVVLHRGEEAMLPRGSTEIQAGDRVLIATRKDDMDDLRALFGE